MSKILSSLVIFSLMMMGCVFGENAAPSESASSAAQVKCFVCNELTDPKCRDPFSGDKSFEQTCEDGASFCRKTVQYVNGRSSVIRQCAKELYKPGYEGCYKTAGKSTQNVCTCKGNADKPCNSGFVMKSSISAIALSVFLAYLIKY